MSEIRVKSTGKIKLFESDNTSSVTIASPASLSANRTITIPDADVDLTNIAVNTAKTGITSSQSSAITANTAKTSNATHSGEVTGATALTIADNIVDEANLKISNTPTNGYVLSAQSGNTGGLTWVEAGGGITHADQWRTTSDFQGDVEPITNLERVDTYAFGGIGTAMSESSGIFTFPVTGVWLITATGFFYSNVDSRFNDITIQTSAGGAYNIASYASQFIAGVEGDNSLSSATCQFMMDCIDTSSHKCRFSTNVSNNNVYTSGDSATNKTHFTFVRLGDT